MSDFKAGDPCLIHSMPADAYHGWDYVAQVQEVREDGTVVAGREVEGAVLGTITFGPDGKAEWPSGYGPQAPNHAAIYTIVSKEAWTFFRREAAEALKRFVAGHSLANAAEIRALQDGLLPRLQALLDYAEEAEK